MKMKIEKQNKKQACKIEENAVYINGIGPFCEHPRKENFWIYNGRMPSSNCWIFNKDGKVEIHNVIVYNPLIRKSGHGRAMISDIRRAFPQSHIWVDTWNCTRPFWQKMHHEGFIDSIANDYSWPCINTTCMICHPNRSESRRRVFQ